MKTIVLITCSIFFFAFSTLINAQQLKTVILDEDEANLVVEDPVLNAGDSLKFVSINGDFAVLIYDAAEFLDIDEADLDIIVTEATSSNEYEVRSLEKGFTKFYYIFSFGNDEWPDAPPRIIIVGFR